GSGNAGTTNVMRTAGLLPGILTFVFDAAKGFVGAFIGKAVFEYLFTTTELTVFTPIFGAYVCYIFVMIGHIFPVFFGFRGGKGIATSVGGFAVCCPIAIAIGLGAFAVSVLTSKIVSLSSLIATVFVVVFAVVFADANALVLPQIIMAIIAGAIVFYTHRTNIVRLLRGEEKKLTIGRGKK
ncbi:MAG: glycerol-3-phosphate acyltransferase, partial [Clostridia bacterium]|nr:glycerol-3-phosphate acyltransferase [Clostridia bacterium]